MTLNCSHLFKPKEGCIGHTRMLDFNLFFRRFCQHVNNFLTTSLKLFLKKKVIYFFDSYTDQRVVLLTKLPSRKWFLSTPPNNPAYTLILSDLFDIIVAACYRIDFAKRRYQIDSSKLLREPGYLKCPLRKSKRNGCFHHSLFSLIRTTRANEKRRSINLNVFYTRTKRTNGNYDRKNYRMNYYGRNYKSLNLWQ